jgi:hypothetical protein
MVLNVIHNKSRYNDEECGKDLLLRCSKGHILKYQGPSNHIDYCREYLKQIESKNNIKNEEPISEINKLKNEIDLLKQQIENFKNTNNKNIIPSAPLEQKNNMESNTFNSVDIQIVEAQLIE